MGPADFHLANQVIRQFAVPIILVQRPRTRSKTKHIRKLLTAGPLGMVDWWLNRQFEARRQRELREDLAGRFAAIRSKNSFEPGPRVVEVDDVHAPKSIELLHEAGVNVLLQNGAGIIRAPLIRAFPDRIVNVHHGWLPAIRGCHSIAWGLLENRPDWIGVTIHLIDERLDTGPILAREHIAPSPLDTYASLFFAATVAGGRLLTQAIADLTAGLGSPIARTEPGQYRPAMTRRGWLALQNAGNRAAINTSTVDTPRPVSYDESPCPTPMP